MLKDYIKLHFIVVIWGFTAILSVLISVPPLETVFYRTFVAIFGLLFLCRGRLYLPWLAFVKIFFIGTLVGLHWILFFASVNVGAASVGLAGLSTMTLWTAILEPLILRRPIATLEVILGVTVMGGLYLIYQFQTDQILGLLLGVGAAFVACLFSIFNAIMVRTYHHITITLYGMVGACAMSLAAIFAGTFFDRPTAFVLTGYDWVWLGMLGLVCTVYPYSETLELLKRLSVFATSLSINMEPVYGMILAAFILGEHKHLVLGFYLGAGVIMASILLYLGVTRHRILKARAAANWN